MRHRFDPWVGKIPWWRKMATHSSILAWAISWTEEPHGLQSMGSQRIRQTELLRDMTEQLSTHICASQCVLCSNNKNIEITI